MEDKLDDAWLDFAKETEPKDNPAGDPPETRTGEKDNAASYSGVSLTEEAQAEKIKEGALFLSVRQQYPFNIFVTSLLARSRKLIFELLTYLMAGIKDSDMESMAVAGGKSVLSEELPEAVQSATENVAPEDKVGLAGLGRSETPDIIRVEEVSSEGGIGKNGDGLGGEWEVVSEKDKSDTDSEKAEKSPGKLQAAAKEIQATFNEGQKQISEEERLENMSKKLEPEVSLDKPRRVGFTSKNTAEPGLLNVPRRARKFAKLSMEAMIRGFEKFTEEEETHNVAAWHNAIRP